MVVRFRLILLFLLFFGGHEGLFSQSEERNKFWYGQMMGLKSPLGAWGITCERAVTIGKISPRILVGLGIREAMVYTTAIKIPVFNFGRKLDVFGVYYVSYFSKGTLEYEVSNDLEEYDISSSIAQTPTLQINFKPFPFDLAFTVDIGQRIYFKSPYLNEVDQGATKLESVNRTIDSGTSVILGVLFAF